MISNYYKNQADAEALAKAKLAKEQPDTAPMCKYLEDGIAALDQRKQPEHVKGPVKASAAGMSAAFLGSMSSASQNALAKRRARGREQVVGKVGYEWKNIDTFSILLTWQS